MQKTIRHPMDEHERVQTVPVGESLTKQSEAVACDINELMKRYEKTGVIEHVRQNPGQYLDLTSAMDYHSAMNVVTGAQEAFEELPAPVRKRFGNDPAAFLMFAENPENEAEMVEMGLLPEAVPQEVVADTPPENAADPVLDPEPPVIPPAEPT